jgi:hypothetical protein
MDSSPSPPSSRNPWPWAIIGFFAVFISWTVGFVVFSLFHRVELVRPDYYAEELRFQNQIERREHTQPIAGRVNVAFSAADQLITLTLPPEHIGQALSGMIHFYRPSAAGLDRRIALDVNAAGQQTIDARPLSAGLWRVRLTWTAQHRDYQHDQAVIVARAATKG